MAYLGRALAPRNLGLSAYEKECLALLLAIDHWRPYLQQAEFLVRTDQKSLLHLTDQRLNTPIQQRAFTKLLGLQHVIQYKAGISNKAADALSRREHIQEDELTALSVCKPAWLEAVRTGYQEGATTKDLLARVALDPVGEPDYKLQGGILRFKGRVRLFAWKGMKQQVKEFVKQCMTCQQAKTERVSSAGLLQPLPIPKRPWAVVSLDFIEGLPKSGGYNAILVVVDKFCKYAHFVPLRHPFTALDIAKTFMHEIYHLHGLPLGIISDRDRIFTSQVWQELFRLCKMELRMSSSYHPQTDGQTERVNQCLETYLRWSVHSCPGNWSRWLALAEYWYNTTFHSALGRTPFEVIYGHLLREFGIDQVDTSTVPDLAAWLQEREILKDHLQQQLKKAQDRMKIQADRHRTDRSFEVGDAVLLKLQPFIQTSVARRPFQKLAFRYYGPYTIQAKVGAVAYRLDLPDTSKIHPVVHVSLLKRAVGATVPVSADLPPPDSVLQAPHSPVQVLECKTIRSHGEDKASHSRLMERFAGRHGYLGRSRAAPATVSVGTALGSRRSSRRGECHDWCVGRRQGTCTGQRGPHGREAEQ